MKNARKAFILDGYVDEPACFGVPPYVSPYVRYCAGVLAAHDVETRYATCDAWRKNRQAIQDAIADADLVVTIMGLTVPGRYRGGSPLTLRELLEIASIRRKGSFILGGPVKSGYTLRGGSRAGRISPEGVDRMALGDPEASLDHFLRTGDWDAERTRDYELIDRAAPLGAEIVRQHPNYPDVIAEMELSRGCDRMDGRCSFCTEGSGAFFKTYEERGISGVAEEFAALNAAGVRAFRLGRCANILAFGADRTERGFRPNPGQIGELYSEIHRAAPKLEVLHTDNCNPATIARFPDESRAAIAAIVRFNTPGDGLSLGIESLDPIVREKNSLKVSLEEAISVVRLIGEIGMTRRDGTSLPAILPGINFLYGLAGESSETLEWNTKFLRAILNEGLAVRRINIRKAIVFDGSPLSKLLDAQKGKGIRERDLRKWKEWVRDEVDPMMLERVAPDGTILKMVVAEERAGKIIFGRQLGSYPPLVGIVSDDAEPGAHVDIAVTDRGGRSLTGVPWPLDIGTCSRAQLMALPGIGSARADFLISKRPYGTNTEIKKALAAMDAPGIADRLMGYFTATKALEVNLSNNVQ